MSKKNKSFELKLKKKLRISGTNTTPKEFLKQVNRGAILTGISMTILSFMLIQKKGGSLLLVPIIGFIFFLISRSILMKSIDGKISKSAKKIDKDVLFAGRFLLIKLNSGKPLINSLEEASKSYGVASHYFKTIIRDIQVGTSLEDALTKASNDCPSKKMRRILFQINNALKIGIDVSNNLESVLEEITNEQLVEIQKYGKKLNSLTMFYMLLAIVLPSLGMTMFIVIAGLVSLNISLGIFLSFLFFLIMVGLIFLSLFKQVRPNVNI